MTDLCGLAAMTGVSLFATACTVLWKDEESTKRCTLATAMFCLSFVFTLVTPDVNVYKPVARA